MLERRLSGEMERALRSLEMHFAFLKSYEISIDEACGPIAASDRLGQGNKKALQTEESLAILGVIWKIKFIDNAHNTSYPGIVGNQLAKILASSNKEDSNIQAINQRIIRTRDAARHFDILEFIKTKQTRGIIVGKDRLNDIFLSFSRRNYMLMNKYKFEFELPARKKEA